MSPVNTEWVGQMISIPIKTKTPEDLQRKLFTDYRIEVPLMRHGNSIYLRYSINGYNSQEDLDALYNALKREKGEMIV